MGLACSFAATIAPSPALALSGARVEEVPVGDVFSLQLHGTTLVAPAGPNGFVYRFAEGATEWQEVAIDPPIAPGLIVTDLVIAGGDLFAGGLNRAYRSEDDAQTWTFVGNGLGSGGGVFLAWDGADLFAGVDFQGNNFRLLRSSNRGDSCWGGLKRRF